MDLITAKVDAAKQSREQKKRVYIIVDGEGECTLATTPKDGAITVYANGSEVALESDIKESTTQPIVKKSKTQKTTAMETTAKKAAKKVAKKEVKKAAAKKVAPKKEAPKKEARPSNLIGKATTLFLTAGQWKTLESKDGNLRTLATEAVIKHHKL